MKKYIVLYAAFLILPLVSFSQSTNVTTLFHGNVKKADVYFNHYAYRNALTLYLHAHDQDPENVYIMDQIAECYFKLHDPVSAELWYAKIIDKPNLHPLAKYEYAEVLSMNGKYEESKYWFEQYAKENPENTMVKEQIEFLANLKNYLSDSLRFIVTGVNFNTSHSEYGVHYFHDGLVFASSRDLDWYLKHTPFDAVDLDESLLNMYYVPGKSKGEHGQVESLHKEHIKSVLHEGPVAFFNQDKRAAYTRTNIKNGKPVYDKNHKAHLQIFFADVETLSSMTNITPFEHNSIDYSVAHPTLSPDGSIMYFSSTAPGGLGGSDIYSSTNINGKWSVPENVGPTINTPGDESFPFLANDTTLYFSSNGHGTLGGLDILVSYKHQDKFRKAINFGGPLNSRFDDFSLVTDSTGRVGYLASNRPGGMGLDDIYHYEATNYFLTGRLLAYDKTGDPVEGAAIYAIDKKTGDILDSDITDNDGRYGLSLPFDKDYKIVVKKDGYDMLNDLSYSTQGNPMGTDSLNALLWKRDLFAKGRIYSNETQQPLAGVTVIAHDLNTNKSDTLTLNERSEYTLPLQPDKKYRLQFSKPDYITKELEINTDGILRGTLLNDVVLVQESIGDVVIHFEYNKSVITEESRNLMKPLIATLKKFPKSTLNIGAHADSRGSVAYNQRLTDDRAKNTRKYFTSQGISGKRITAKGFGEKLLLNQCSDGVVCEEQQHTLNRRAEVKVQKD